MGADGNLLTIENYGTTRFIFDAEGSAHADVEWITFDGYDDLTLMSDFETAMISQDPVKAEMIEFLKYNRRALEKAGIVHFDQEHLGHAFVNFTRLAMLLVGAVRQLNQKVERLALAG